MIGRVGKPGTVCLSCRLQLIRQLTPVRRFASDSTTSNPAPEEPNDNNDDKESSRKDAPQKDAPLRTVITQNESRNTPLMKRLDFRRKHKAGHLVLEESAARLETDMLGKPAYALLMREGGKVRKRRLPTTKPMQEEVPSVSNLAAMMEDLIVSQRIPATFEEVRESVESLRPLTEKTLSEKDFVKLKELVLGSFLTSQLQEYLKWWSKSKVEPSAEKPGIDPETHSKFPWLLGMSPWVPLLNHNGAVNRAGHLLQNYVTGTMTPKEKLAIRLMRECWGLSIAELESQLGETRIKLRDEEFALLMRGSQRFMRNIGKMWLEPPMERIEAIQDDQIFQLFSKKTKVELFLRELDQTLKNVRSKAFPLRLVSPEQPDDATLEELGRLTNTHVTRSPTQRKLNVMWIEAKSRVHELLEDPSHIVFRLLLTASGPQPATETLVSTVPPDNSSGRLLVDTTSRDKLGWKDRMMKWARYAFPLTVEEGYKNEDLPIEKFALPFEPSHPKMLDVKREVVEPTVYPEHPVTWSNTTRTSTVAHFGHLLHPHQLAEPESLLPTLLSSTQRRVFSPVAPSAIRLAELEETIADPSSFITNKFTLLLRFWPSPSPSPNPATTPTGRTDTPPAPVIELRLDISDDEVRGVHSLRAVRRVHHTDVLLPASPVDVRFTQTQYETLQAPDREALALWPPISDFLNHARLDIAKGKVEVCKRQKFPVPHRLIAAQPPPPPTTTTASPSTSTSTSTSTATSSSVPAETTPPVEGENEFTSIQYEFVGLELHRSASLPYDEHHRLTYTSIEAGQGGGRRAELTLEPVETLPNASTSSEPVNNNILQKTFLDACSSLVANETLWSGYDNEQ
ncbi:hypothetical protein GGS20DRAFT_553536 [Poronia punctata]|nr:hypothetical protein GGS20DRAFT_553536 [Poronia punctata]